MPDLMKQFENVKSRYERKSVVETRKCPHCFTDIPSAARKCRYCGEFVSRWRMSSRTWWEIVIVLSLLFIIFQFLIVTNPSSSNFEKFLDDEISNLVYIELGRRGLSARVINMVSKSFIKASVERRNCIICSLYGLNFYGEKIIYLGIMTKFVKIPLK